MTINDVGQSGFQLSFTLSTQVAAADAISVDRRQPDQHLARDHRRDRQRDAECDDGWRNDQPSDSPGARRRHMPRCRSPGKILRCLMDKIDFSGIPFPATPAEGRVALLLFKYAVLGHCARGRSRAS